MKRGVAIALALIVASCGPASPVLADGPLMLGECKVYKGHYDGSIIVASPNCHVSAR